MIYLYETRWTDEKKDVTLKYIMGKIVASSHFGFCQLLAVFFLLAGCLMFLAADRLAADEQLTAKPFGYVFEIEGPIGPAIDDYLARGLNRARDNGAKLVIIRMDTPGGLDTSMRNIIKKIITAPMPIVSYVAPGGARAASAGTYILYASHVAAMAPGTNLGAATPVRIGSLPLPGGKSPERQPPSSQPPAGQQPPAVIPHDAMEKKIINDSVAYLRGLAQMRGRNVEWAEKTVREGASLPAKEAVAMGVVDILAADLKELLAALDGRRVMVQGKMQTIDTAGLQLRIIKPDWRSLLLAVITNPNLAYIFMLLGIYGIFFVFTHPGYILPGVVGAICLLLALFAFHLLPINYAGLALIILGLAFMLAEAFVPSFGALGIGGIVAFVVGSVILLRTEVEGFILSPWLVGFVALLSGGFVIGVLGMVVKARRRPVVSGREQLLGSEGEVLADFTGEGTIRLQGELWRARAVVKLTAGQRVRVTNMDGLTAIIEPVKEQKRKGERNNV